MRLEARLGTYNKLLKSFLLTLVLVRNVFSKSYVLITTTVDVMNVRENLRFKMGILKKIINKPHYTTNIPCHTKLKVLSSEFQIIGSVEIEPKR